VAGGPEAFRRILERFEAENPDLRVVDEVLPSSSDQQHQFYVIHLGAGSDRFDVFSLDVIWVPEFARAGWLLDASDLFGEADLADFLPGPLEAVSLRGSRWAVPWYVDGGVLYYRSDLLERHGLEPPRTMEDLASSARAILDAEADPGLAGYLWQGKQYEGLVCVALEMLAANGASILENGKSALETRRAVEALAFLRRLVEEGISPPLVTTADEERTRNLFGAGRAIYMRNWPYAWNLLQADGSAVRGKIGVVPVPGFAGGRPASTLGGWQLGINRNSTRPEAARRLVRYLTSPEVERALALEVGYKPSRRSVYDDPELREAQPFVASLRGILEHATPRPVTPFYAMISQVLQVEFSAVVSGIRTPQQAMRAATIQLNHLLGDDRG